MDSTLLVLEVLVHNHMFLLQDPQFTSYNVRIVNFPLYFYNFPPNLIFTLLSASRLSSIS